MISLARLLPPLLLLALSACAGTSPTKEGGSSRNAEGAVMDRALERWNLLIKRDAGAAWDYLSPGYRATHPRDIYAKEMSQRPVQWFAADPYVQGKGSDTRAVECDASGQSCEVRVRLRFKFRSQLASVGMLESATVVKENWIKLKGQWYLVPKDVAG